MPVACHTALPTIDQPFLIHYKVLFQCHCTKLTYILLFWYEAAPEWLRIYHTVTMATHIPFTLGHLHVPSIHKDRYVLWIHKSNYIFTTIDTQLWINCLILSLHRKAYYLCKHKHDIVRFPYFHSCIIIILYCHWICLKFTCRIKCTHTPHAYITEYAHCTAVGLHTITTLYFMVKLYCK